MLEWSPGVPSLPVLNACFYISGWGEGLHSCVFWPDVEFGARFSEAKLESGRWEVGVPDRSVSLD